MAPTSFKLVKPITYGSEVIEEFAMEENTRSFREFSLPMTADGKIDFQPYQLAKVGVQLAGHSPGFVDKLSVADMNRLALVVLGFLGLGQKDGSAQ